ncbi:hypothetical protein GCM10017714_09560 [Curtobacterium pusillum]|nr:hypothetical protein GCM10017610_05030 [Curtobacterium pusillum]
MLIPWSLDVRDPSVGAADTGLGGAGAYAEDPPGSLRVVHIRAPATRCGDGVPWNDQTRGAVRMYRLTKPCQSLQPSPVRG